LSQLVRKSTLICDHGERSKSVGPWGRIARMAKLAEVVYRVEDENVLILVAGKRNDDEVYRQLDRR